MRALLNIVTLTSWRLTMLFWMNNHKALEELGKEDKKNNKL